MTFDALAQTFLEKMNGKKITEQPFAWRPAKGGPGRMETDALRSETISKDLKRDVYVKWAMIRVDAAHVVLINFTMSPANEVEKARFEEATEGMVRSVAVRGQ
mgnify:FL=1